MRRNIIKSAKSATSEERHEEHYVEGHNIKDQSKKKRKERGTEEHRLNEGHYESAVWRIATRSVGRTEERHKEGGDN